METIYIIYNYKALDDVRILLLYYNYCYNMSK